MCGRSSAKGGSGNVVPKILPAKKKTNKLIKRKRKEKVKIINSHAIEACTQV
jgi:hypothetical protein